MKCMALFSIGCAIFLAAVILGLVYLVACLMGYSW